MKNMYFSFFVIASLFSTTLPANADWQMTSWHMSVDELAALNIARELPVENQHNADSTLARYVMPYPVQNIAMDAIFYFSELDGTQKLTEVRLDVTNNSDCPWVLGMLRSTYGSEERDSGGSILNYLIWRDSRNGNRVIYSVGVEEYSSLGCQITYQPIPEANTSGGL